MIKLSKFFLQKLLLLILICPGLYSQDLDKILWGETQLSGPINFDFIKVEKENIEEYESFITDYIGKGAETAVEN